jgi:hypothetical protein
MRLVIGRLINSRPPAHTMSTNSAANGVFDQVNTQLEWVCLRRRLRIAKQLGTVQQRTRWGLA